jgi:hypothetical protein
VAFRLFYFLAPISLQQAAVAAVEATILLLIMPPVVLEAPPAQVETVLTVVILPGHTDVVALMRVPVALVLQQLTLELPGLQAQAEQVKVVMIHMMRYTLSAAVAVADILWVVVVVVVAIAPVQLVALLAKNTLAVAVAALLM